MSQNTGLHPFMDMAWDVDAKENGVVMTSPFNSKTFMAMSNPKCPFTVGQTCSAPVNSFRPWMKRCRRGPSLVSHLFFQISSVSLSNSFLSGRKGFVTVIGELSSAI